jgi:hypothetical protein
VRLAAPACEAARSCRCDAERIHHSLRSSKDSKQSVHVLTASCSISFSHPVILCLQSSRCTPYTHKASKRITLSIPASEAKMQKFHMVARSARVAAAAVESTGRHSSSAVSRLQEYLQRRAHTGLSGSLRDAITVGFAEHVDATPLERHSCQLISLADGELLASATACRKRDAKELAAGRALKALQERDNSALSEFRFQAFLGDMVRQARTPHRYFHTRSSSRMH